MYRRPPRRRRPPSSRRSRKHPVRLASLLILRLLRRPLLDLDAASAPHVGGRSLQHDFKNAVVERRLRAVRDRAVRERHHPAEAAVAPLAAEDAVTLFLVVVPPLASDAQLIVRDVH